MFRYFFLNINKNLLELVIGRGGYESKDDDGDGSKNVEYIF